MKIYTITTVNSSHRGLYDTRCVGYMETQKDAQAEILNNSLDMHENSYKYAVIEEIGPGLYFLGRKEWWFRWSWVANGYVSCKKPTAYSSIVNFSIG